MMGIFHRFLIFSFICVNLLSSQVRSEEFDEVSFAILGDWGAELTDPSSINAQQVVAKAMESYLPSVNPPIQFILAPGDNFYPAGLSGDLQNDLFRLNHSFTQMYPNRSPFNVPWYFNVGNHDYEGLIDGQLNEKIKKFEGRWNFPKRFYQKSFFTKKSNENFPLLDLFVIDTNVAGEYAGESDMEKNFVGQNYTEQLEWLQASIKSSKANWCIVAGHHTVYVALNSSGISELQTSLSPILEQSNCIYIGGHEHDLEHNIYNGVNYIVSGGGCQTAIPPSIIPPPVLPKGNIAPWNLFVDVEAGYSTMKINKTQITLKHINYLNQIVYETNFYNSKKQ